MNRNLFLSVLALALSLQVGAQGLPEWEDPQVIGINKEAYHATLTLPSKKAECQQVRSLNGQWKFHWAKDPLHRPADFYREDFDSSSWEEITVPGNWQMQGYGIPIYSNWTYPFVKDAPYVMGLPPKEYFSHDNRNPIGSYLTSFEIGASEIGKSVFLVFDVAAVRPPVDLYSQSIAALTHEVADIEFCRGHRVLAVSHLLSVHPDIHR